MVKRDRKKNKDNPSKLSALESQKTDIESPKPVSTLISELWYFKATKEAKEKCLSDLKKMQDKVTAFDERVRYLTKKYPKESSI